MARRHSRDWGIATTYRYPTSRKIPTGLPSDKLEMHITKVDVLLEQAVDLFGVDLGKQGSPARTTKPIR